jgi:hypothetical protein
VPSPHEEDEDDDNEDYGIRISPPHSSSSSSSSSTSGGEGLPETPPTTLKRLRTLSLTHPLSPLLPPSLSNIVIVEDVDDLPLGEFQRARETRRGRMSYPVNFFPLEGV